MGRNKGYEIEAKFRRVLNGTKATHDFYDIDTEPTLYEVKSCKITVRCTNGNEKRPYVNQPHKPVKTRQYGKFRVIGANHTALIKLAKMRKKKAKYIFVVYYQDSMIHRIVDAKVLGLPDEEKWFHIPISQVFR